MRGDLDDAENMYRQALATNEELGRKEGMAAQYGNLGIVCRVRGDLDEAESQQRKALEIYKEAEDDFGVASISLNIGRTQLEKGDKIAGCEMLMKAKQLAQEIGAQGCVDVTSQLIEAFGCECS